MIEFKIYSQISNFIETNEKTKVHADVLSPYLLVATGSLASRYLCIVALPLGSTLFSLYFQCFRIAKEFLAI